MTFKAPAGSNWDEWENQFNWVVFPSYDEDFAKSQELSISSAKKSKHKDLESDMNSLLWKSPTDQIITQNSLLKSSSDSGHLQSL